MQYHFIHSLWVVCTRYKSWIRWRLYLRRNNQVTAYLISKYCPPVRCITTYNMRFVLSGDIYICLIKYTLGAVVVCFAIVGLLPVLTDTCDILDCILPGSISIPLDKFYHCVDTSEIMMNAMDKIDNKLPQMFCTGHFSNMNYMLLCI